MRSAVPAGAGGHDAPVTAPECAAAARGMRAARSGGPDYTLLSQVGGSDVQDE